MVTANELMGAFADLPQEEQQKVAQAIRALPAPPEKFVGWLWLIVVVSLALVLVGGMWLLYSLVQGSKDTAVIVPLVTGALGAVVGLLAPSPVSKTGD